MIHFINDDHLFLNNTETHYRYHKTIDPSIYPQVHNFYEIILVTSGILHLELCGRKYSLQPGSLALIRPGDVHTKSGTDIEHINLAFPPNSVDELFQYLKNESIKETLLALEIVPPVILEAQSYAVLFKQLKFLNTIEYKNWESIRTYMRSILFEVMTAHIFPSIAPSNIFHDSSSDRSPNARMPHWLKDALTQWQTAEFRQEGLDFFCGYTGLTKEYICRTFKRCFGQTPSVYLNHLRLNYAINLLIHSDYSITDIAYESGFKSLSRFYHTFHGIYGVTPKQFRYQHTHW